LSRRISTSAVIVGAMALLNCSSGGENPSSSGGVGSARAGSGPGGGMPSASSSGGAATSPGGGGGTLNGGAGQVGMGGSDTAGRGGSTASGGAGTSNGSGAGGSLTSGGGGNAGRANLAGSGGASGGTAGSSGNAAAGAGGGIAGKAGSGSGGAPTTLPFSYYIGADVTDQEVQSDSTRSDLLTLMQAHGFNYIRLRTFVDPKASDGYDKQNGYDDITHTVSFGKQVKDAGMGLLVDFHYSDNWADPGKQCVPIAWQSDTTIADLATAVHDYTKDAITELIAGGARPDMVQIGNEITPGMLIHRCDSGGQPTGDNPVTGSISNWTNLGTLLKAGVQGVKDVDSGIVISLHIDRGDDLASSKSFITNAQTQGVKFDAFGESCYTAYQGPPSGWQSTFQALSTQFPALKLFIAEYGPEQKAANDMIYALPNDQGIGTFNWEPTTQGDWNTGHDLIRRSGNAYVAQPDLALYDQMKIDYANRL
jgi:arabinogalactan endo-1,4-beta-galactosidase